MCAVTDGLGANEQLLKGGKTYRPIVLNNNNNKGKKEKVTHRNFENHSTTT